MTEVSTEPALVWGVKESFRTYIVGVGGTIEVTPPATEVDEQQFSFPLAEGAADDDIIRFAGGVRFSAHHGMLTLVIDEVWLHHHDRDHPRLSVGTMTALGRLFLVDLTPTEPEHAGHLLRWANVPTKLTTEGGAAFDFRYPTGTELAPVSYTLPAAG